jgi:hypothetical protein
VENQFDYETLILIISKLADTTPHLEAGTTSGALFCQVSRDDTY